VSGIDVVSALVWCGGYGPDRRLLLQYRVNTPRHADHWSTPGGKVEPGESPEAAIARELEEEIGVHIAPPDEPAFTYEIEGGLRFAGYLVDAWYGEVANREPEFCAQIGWFAPGELPRPLTPGTRALIELAGIR
jgi:8-oxo-dGTP diphosphatase